MLISSSFLRLIRDMVSWSLPEHVELAWILKTEVVKHHRSNHKLGLACFS